MNILNYAKHSLLHYRRTTIGVFAGALITSMLITGTLLVGDSAGKTLRNIALARLGKTDLLLNSRERFFRTELSGKIQAELCVPVSSVLMIDGIGMTDGAASRQINNVNILGIDSSFLSFTDNTELDLKETEAAINQTVARKLGLSAGDDISLRINKPGILPRDAMLSSRAEAPYSRGIYTVKMILSDDDIGRFSPRANQLPPNNVFIRRSELEIKAGLKDQANLMLVQYSKDERVELERASDALKKVWDLDDLGLKLRTYKPKDVYQLESSRVFLTEIFTELKTIGAGSLTYMVNSISRTEAATIMSTPYSFVNAIAPSDDRALSPVPSDMNDDQVIINSWLADELDVKVDDDISIDYYRMDDNGKLSEYEQIFEVHSIIDIADLRSEEFLAPDFPGLSDVESCAGWDIGMPMDEEMLKDEANEKYWNTYRGTPKLFVTLAAGQAMWSNRYGDMTAIRFSGNTYDAQSIRELIRERIDPAQLGYFFESARDQAEKSAGTAMDLGQLFSGMSFFLIIAALMLTVLLFSFGVDQRSSEIGSLIAMGFTRKRIRTLFLAESSLLAIVSSIAGAVAAFYYTKLLLAGLSGAWSDAVAGSAIEFYAHPATPFTGAVSSFIIIIAVITLSIRRKSKILSHNLLTGTSHSGHFENIFANISHMNSICSLPAIAALALMVHASINLDNPANLFYLSGALLLISGIAYTALLLSRVNSSASMISLKNLCLKNAGRKPYRSIAVAGILACGVFIVFSVFAMKQDITKNTDKRWSGTGGFELFAQTSLPILDDINTPEGKELYEMDSSALPDDIEISCIKVREGDDASCFNLNRSLTPSILGIDHSQMSELGAFVQRNGNDNPWELLGTESDDGIIPGLAGDANTALWGLQKKVGPKNGDIITIRDDQGIERKIKLVGTLPMKLSVFQGKVIISKEAFTRLFPSVSGYNMFVADVPENKTLETATQLRDTLGRLGIEIQPGGERLAQFYSVESAYLSMFLALGGLGLVLGTAGLGIVLTRNTIERRNELALMRCIGFTQTDIRKILVSEYAGLIAAGMICGITASLAAISPNLNAATVQVPWKTMLWLTLGISLSSILFTLLAIMLSTKDEIISSLRQE